MSEIIGYEVPVISVSEDQSDESDNSAYEKIDDTVLYNLVSANANVRVRCYWLQDRVMTLSEAMNAYHSKITDENMDMVIADALQLLANPVTETAELAEEDSPEEEEPEQAEVQKVQEDSKVEDAERQSKKEIDGTKHLEQSASREEKTSESEGSNVIAAETGVVANLGWSESGRSAQGVAKAEAVDSSSNSRAHTTSGKSPGAPEALAVTSSTSGSSALESATNKNDQEFRPMAPQVEDQFNETKLAIKSKVEAKQQMPAFETPEADVAVNPIVEAKPAPDRPELATDQEIESPTLSVALEAAIEPAFIELSPLDFESASISGDITELSVEKIEAAEYETALVNLDYEMGTNSHTDFVEEEILLDPLEEVDLEPGELDMFSIPTWEGATDNSDESNLSGQMEITSPEQLVQISLTIEKIEDSLIQLTERIEASEPETTERVNEILDKIIDVPAKLEAHNGENIITETEAQEELDELFTELLDKMGIDYTPELIESLASLTLKWHLADEIEKLKSAEETDKAPPGSGTHKIIKKLLAGLSAIKKAIAHAYAIGKSALQLYTSNFAT